MATRKVQIRFSQADDLKLLREVLAAQPSPFADEKQWAGIAKKLMAAVEREFVVDSRRVRERSMLLLDQFIREDSEAIGRSGTEEEYIEKWQLLDEIRDLQKEAEKQKEDKKKQQVREEAKATQIRKRALETLAEKKTGDEVPTTSKRPTVMSYLKDKTSNEFNIRQQEVELRKEELALQKQRFELEKEERQQRLRNKQNQNQLMLQLMKKNYGKIISLWPMAP